MRKNNRSANFVNDASSRLRAANQRFDWLCDELRDDVCRADAAALGQVLGDATARTASQERALIMLGLLGSARAEAQLEWFDPVGAHWRVRLLHRLARRECARRRTRQSGRARAASKTRGASKTAGQLAGSRCGSKIESTASGGRPSAAFSPARTTGRSISEGCSHIASIRSSRSNVSSSRLSNA